MNWSTVVTLVAVPVIGGMLIWQVRLLHARAEHFRTERLRGALYLTILFVSFAVLHWYVAESEKPPPDPCCLTLFGEEEPPPPGMGEQVEPPPAPPLPPPAPPRPLPGPR